MKRKLLWRVLLIAGLVPFAAPFGICCILTVRTSGLSLVDCILVYSIFLWPTDIVGIVLILLSMVIKMKNDC